MPNKKGSKNKIKEKLPIPIKSELYKATLRSVGRIYQAEGTTIEEALEKIKMPNGAKAMSVLTIEHGDKKKDRILNGITTAHLFGQGSPTTREIHLKKVKQLFDI